mgnify:FL=1|tara:strand:+ start:200 stop:796 length:597 start_codon:yes stop_codon:yes gene_type:complete
MNIFYLDKCPVKSAEMSCDKHVVKMILESAQLLCTVHRVSDGVEYYDKTANGRKIKRWKHPNNNLEKTLYKAGWLKHPSTEWLFESAFNYDWLYTHMMALNEEYKKRYNHKDDHIAIQKLGEVLKLPPIKFKNIFSAPTDIKPAMPDYCKIKGDAVASYRKYYIMEKRRFATWKSPATTPAWYVDGVNKIKEKECQSQ